MSKNGKYKVVYFRPGQRKVKKQPSTEEEINAQLEGMTPEQLADGINNLISAIRKQGVEIADYDSQKRKLYKIQRVHGKLFFLAAEPEE